MWYFVVIYGGIVLGIVFVASIIIASSAVYRHSKRIETVFCKLDQQLVCLRASRPARPITSPNLSAVLYINLAHRTDRRESVESAIQSCQFSPSVHIHRIDAIKNSHGGNGWSMSHNKALQYALDHKFEHTLILEDDALPLFDGNVSQHIQTVLHKIKDKYDVWSLGTENPHPALHEEEAEQVWRASDIYSRTSYIVHRDYIPFLMASNQTSIDNLSNKVYRPNYRLFAGDRVWQRLQAPDNWYLSVPNVFYQQESYSDIQNRMTKYTTAQQIKQPSLSILQKNQINKEPIKCTVFILNYNRPHNIFKQLKQPYMMDASVDEIIIMNRHPDYFIHLKDIESKELKQKVRILEDFDNRMGAAKRFELALQSTNEYILNLDDDICPSTKLFHALLQNIDLNPIHL